MKDLEKIKSEDLAAQVQDANPGNFAIEQEVAQLVGATVPAPTEPSADDARELGAQLLVFLRRALLPIRSSLRTAVAAIYAHLDSRCTDYTPAAYAPFQDPSTVPPYDPMRPLTPRTLPNLLTALTAFSARKISNGSTPNDGIPDGTSLAHLLCSSDANNVLAIGDDNKGWSMTKPLDSLLTVLPYVTKVQLSPSYIEGNLAKSCPRVTEFDLTGVRKIKYSGYGYPFVGSYAGEVFDAGDIEEVVDVSGGNDNTRWYFQNCQNLKTVRALKLRKFWDRNSRCIFQNCPNLQEVLVPSMDEFAYAATANNGYYMFQSCPNVSKVVVGALKNVNFPYPTNLSSDAMPNLVHLEFGQGTCVNLNLSNWNPTDKGTTFLQNFKEHIALRLTANGSGKTLTLSQAVRDAIHAAEATYGIEAIIVTQKGWTLSPAPTA